MKIKNKANQINQFIYGDNEKSTYCRHWIVKTEQEAIQLVEKVIEGFYCPHTEWPLAFTKFVECFPDYVDRWNRRY